MQVRDSRGLKVVLAAALRVGNAVNTGTHLGGAAAVRLESLLRMAELRVRRSLACSDLAQASACLSSK